VFGFEGVGLETAVLYAMEGNLSTGEIGFLWALAANNLQPFALLCLYLSFQDYCWNSFCILQRKICATLSLQEFSC